VFHSVGAAHDKRNQKTNWVEPFSKATSIPVQARRTEPTTAAQGDGQRRQTSPGKFVEWRVSSRSRGGGKGPPRTVCSNRSTSRRPHDRTSTAFRDPTNRSAVSPSCLHHRLQTPKRSAAAPPRSGWTCFDTKTFQGKRARTRGRRRGNRDCQIAEGVAAGQEIPKIPQTHRQRNCAKIETTKRRHSMVEIAARTRR